MVDVNAETCTPRGRDGASCKSPRLDACLGGEETGQHSDIETITMGNLHDPPAQPQVCARAQDRGRTPAAGQTSTWTTMVHAPAFSF